MSHVYWTIIGSTAALLTSFGFLPQVLKMWRRRSVGDVSLGTLGQFAVGVCLWALYGWYLRDAVLISANLLTLVTLLVGLALFFRFRRAPAGGILQGALRGAEELGVDPAIAVQKSAKGLMHATYEAGGDLAAVTQLAIAEAFEAAQSADLFMTPEKAVNAAAIGVMEAAREFDEEAANRVRKALSQALDDASLQQTPSVQTA
ncbi:MAG: hypothetical protein J5J06_05860 [Phycisphaerae bacterium]|nr:hypothetical protein [Phycisphaerae bacterium]